MTQEPPSETHPENFMQAIVRLGREKGISLPRIQEVTGIQSSGLVAKNLAKNPTFRGFDQAKAEAAIKLVAQPVLHDQLRALDGYPSDEPRIDRLVVRLVQQHKELGIAWGKSFGELYKFNRSQKPVGRRLNEKYLSIADCAQGIMSTASLSEVENGHTKVKLSKGLALIGKLGYRQDEEGLGKFVRDTARMLSAYEVRRQKFGRALQAHMYPAGKTAAFRRSESGITQPHIIATLKCSAGHVTQLLNGTAVPTDAEAEAVIGLFGYSPPKEAKFYNDANLEHDTKAPKPIAGSAPLPAMQVFGDDVRLVREELGIEQTALAAYLRTGGYAGVQEEGMGGLKILTYLESGQRRTPLPDAIRSRILSGLGCSSGSQLHAHAETIRAVEQLRDGHFLESLKTVLEQNLGDAAGYPAAKTLLETKRASGNTHVTPAQARKTLKGLGLTEAQFYAAANVEISEEQAEACDTVASLVGGFEQRRTSLHSHRKADLSRIGRRR